MADVIVDFKIDDEKLWNLVNNGAGTFTLVSRVTDKAAANANAMGAGFRTKKHRGVGDTAPEYGHDTRRFGKGPVGIVYTGNYAAIKDNHLHNTLLKSL